MLSVHSFRGKSMSNKTRGPERDDICPVSKGAANALYQDAYRAFEPGNQSNLAVLAMSSTKMPAILPNIEVVLASERTEGLSISDTTTLTISGDRTTPFQSL
jgi:hypothetical protein